MGRKVSEIMSKRLETIDPEQSIGAAARLMKEKSIRHLLVVDRATGGLLGLISDREIKKMISPFIGSTRATPQDDATATISTGKVMVTKDKLTSAKSDDEIKSVVEKMLIKKYGALPVMDDQGRAIGIVTRGDMLKLLMSFL